MVPTPNGDRGDPPTATDAAGVEGRLEDGSSAGETDLEYDVVTTPVLVVGAGAAGARVAIALAEAGVEPLVIGKRNHGNAHTTWAAGGVNAALGSLEIPYRENVMITRLLSDGRRVVGAVGFDMETGRGLLFRSNRVVLAAGGFSALYRRHSSRDDENNGDAQALTLEAGARLLDLEFVQFHPTGMVGEEWDGRLVTEAVRVARSRHHRGADGDCADGSLHHGRRRHRLPDRRDRRRRAVRCRRGRRGRPWREPPRRELAGRNRHDRQTRRRTRRGGDDSGRSRAGRRWRPPSIGRAGVPGARGARGRRRRRRADDAARRCSTNCCGNTQASSGTKRASGRD